MKRLMSLLLMFSLFFINASFACCAQSQNNSALSPQSTQQDVEKLKIVGVIPARYESSRFPGKPLADICGKPMIWWVYNQAKKVPELNEVYVATDDERIETVCKQYGINVVMTPKDVKTCTERVYEAAKQIKSDVYISINGDEPLIDPTTISKIIPVDFNKNENFVSNLISEIEDPVETIDFTNIKVVTDEQQNIIFMSRSLIPYPKANMNYKYLKHVGVMAYNFKALDFYAKTKKSFNENIEDIDYLRFLENGLKIKAVKVCSKSLSVDTPKDLDRVRELMKERLKKENQNHIQVLDCTLRDGGYINDWNFGKENIEGIIDKLVESKVDIIECGFLKNKLYDDNFSEFNKVSQIDNIIKNYKSDTTFVAMVEADCVDNNFEECTNDTLVKSIRLLFKKDKIELAMEKAELLQSKGYKVFLQPATITDYSDTEFENLIDKANEVHPYAFYIVDTLGIMENKNLLNLFSIADKKLNYDISIGFHSHNNLQLSHSNAQALMNLDTNRNIIIDSSVFGMGRGAGNLCTELLMQDINDKYGDKYNLEPIYNIYDNHLAEIYSKTPWGYSIPLFISAKYNCHPNYAVFLRDCNVKPKDMDKIMSKIDENKKSVYDKKYIDELYKEFLNQKQYDCIAFDLDGTLIDSSKGIYNAIRYVEKKLNIPKLDEDTLKLCIGPSLKYTYGVLHNLDNELLNKAIFLHKEYMSEKGYKECRLYDDVEDLLKYLKGLGKKLVITTLKQESIAKRTLDCLGVSKYFDLILGQNPYESLKKADLLKYIQKNYNTKNIVLIGDSKFDGEAAQELNTDFIALTYGFGFKNSNDTDAYNPIKICDSVYELKDIL